MVSALRAPSQRDYTDKELACDQRQQRGDERQGPARDQVPERDAEKQQPISEADPPDAVEDPIRSAHGPIESAVAEDPVEESHAKSDQDRSGHSGIRFSALPRQRLFKKSVESDRETHGGPCQHAPGTGPVATVYPIPQP